MTKFVGRRGTLGIAKETVRGTPVTPSFYVPFAKMSFGERTEEAREDQGMGILADGDSKYVVMRMGEGDIDSQYYDKALGLILYSLMGAAPVTTGSNPYTHTFTLSNTNQHASLSLLWQDPDRKLMFPNTVVDSLKISVRPNALVEYTTTFKSKTARDWSTVTPSFTSLGSKFLHQHLSFKLAATVGALSGATATTLKSLDLTISANTMFDVGIGTVEPEDILNQQFSVEGSLELNLTDDTYRTLMNAGTYKAMEIQLSNGASSNLQLQFPRVDFSKWEEDPTLNEITKQKIDFKANYDAANALDIISTCVLINTNSSY